MSILNYLSLITIAISGLLLITGIVFIKLGKREIHKTCMIGASVFALIFVGLYLLRTALLPHTPYTGPYRPLFLAILWTHTAMAIINFPLAVMTLRYAFKGIFEKHRKIAPITAFVWLYVVITGWLIYYFMQWLNRSNI
ncbi:DUF420 domain-containing protein [Thermocrinis sp.]